MLFCYQAIMQSSNDSGSHSKCCYSFSFTKETPVDQGLRMLPAVSTNNKVCEDVSMKTNTVRSGRWSSSELERKWNFQHRNFVSWNHCVTGQVFTKAQIAAAANNTGEWTSPRTRMTAKHKWFYKRHLITLNYKPVGRRPAIPSP